MTKPGLEPLPLSIWHMFLIMKPVNQLSHHGLAYIKQSFPTWGQFHNNFWHFKCQSFGSFNATFLSVLNAKIFHICCLLNLAFKMPKMWNLKFQFRHFKHQSRHYKCQKLFI